MSDDLPRPNIDWANYRPPRGVSRCPAVIPIEELLRRGTPEDRRRARLWERDTGRNVRSYADLSLAVGAMRYRVGCILGAGHGADHKSWMYDWTDRTPTPAQRSL